MMLMVDRNYWTAQRWWVRWQPTGTQHPSQQSQAKRPVFLQDISWPLLWPSQGKALVLPWEGKWCRRPSQPEISQEGLPEQMLGERAGRRTTGPMLWTVSKHVQSDPSAFMTIEPTDKSRSWMRPLLGAFLPRKAHWFWLLRWNNTLSEALTLYPSPGTYTLWVCSGTWQPRWLDLRSTVESIATTEWCQWTPRWQGYLGHQRTMGGKWGDRARQELPRLQCPT